MADEADLRRILGEGIQLWNAQRYFECHDKLEEAWQALKKEKKAERAQDPRRDFVHGLILYAAAYVHWQRGNPIGVARKLADARRLFDAAPGPHFDLDPDPWRRSVEAELERGAAGEQYRPAPTLPSPPT